VDTQPATGNNSFPHEQLRAHIVIDHHPPLPQLDADFIDIRPDAGTTTTMLLGYQEALGVEIDAELATAAAYAIVSETQDLGREATRQDLQALHRVFPVARLRTLGEIRHPRHTREYYRTIARAMGRVQVSKNLCVCHIGAVEQAENVAEVADFLVAMEQVTWCLTTGFDGEAMVLSMRTTHTDGHAESIMRKVLGRKGRGGGHGMIAGGRAVCADLDAYGALADELTADFIEQLERRAPQNLRPLLDES
jgi:nanoRNase/pAp phosphatase (c-di-AMP/oligoRNAs hydrolase)